MRQAGLFGLSDHLKRLSAVGDPLEVPDRVVDFEVFRPTLVAALAYGDGSKGGTPPYDPVVMLKVLILAAQNNVGDARMEHLTRDRLVWLRFLGFELGAPTPDANTYLALPSTLQLGLQPNRKAFSKLKAMLRKAEERTVGGLWDSSANSSTSSDPQNAPTTSARADMI